LGLRPGEVVRMGKKDPPLSPPRVRRKVAEKKIRLSVQKKSGKDGIQRGKNKIGPDEATLKPSKWDRSVTKRESGKDPAPTQVNSQA